jgi:Reverse transcriptase (RNA-dependent DNA polymerase)
LDDYYVYYSDHSDSEATDLESELEYNPWIDTYSPHYSEEDSDQENEEKSFELYNPAIFLAENEVANKNKIEEPKAEHHVGPLTYHQQRDFDNVLESFSDICARSQTEIGRTTVIKHRIHVENALPIAQKPYRMNPENAKFLNEEIQRMEANGIVRRSFSPWASPVVIVGKKGGDKRLCIDYRKLNAVTKIDAYPLPRIDDLLDSLGGSQWFTTLDLASGYWQVSMHPDDVEKTAFITPSGLYEFLVMPFGLNNAPGTFQRLMNWVLRDFIGIFVAVYLDDVIIYTKGTFELHLNHVKQVFQSLREAQLCIKLKKCYFCHPSLAFLGHIVGQGGIHPDPEKIKKIKDFPIPTNLT